MPEAQTLEPPTSTTTQTQTTPPASTIDARDATGTLRDQSQAPAPAPEPPKAPEDYADFKLPEGFTFDTKALDAAKSIFKEIGLSQETAQKLVDFQAQRESAFLAANAKAVDDMRADWRDRASKDPVIGPKLTENGGAALKEPIGKMFALLDPQVEANLRKELDITGVGDNPALIRAFYDLALKVNEGKHVSGTGPSGPGQQKPGTSERPSLAAALFPNLPR
jgi:hypothetical protein